MFSVNPMISWMLLFAWEVNLWILLRNGIRSMSLLLDFRLFRRCSLIEYIDLKDMTSIKYLEMIFWRKNDGLWMILSFLWFYSERVVWSKQGCKTILCFIIMKRERENDSQYWRNIEWNTGPCSFCIQNIAWFSMHHGSCLI